MKKIFLFCTVCAAMILGNGLPDGQCQATIAVNDTIDLVPGYPKTVNLLANDIFPAGDSLRITGGTNAGDGRVKSTWHLGGYYTYIAPNRGVGNLIIGTYKLTNFSTAETSTAELVFRIWDRSFTYLDINDVNALFTVYGNHFWLPFGDGSPGFVVPKGSGKSVIFNSSLWIAGKDENDSLHFAGERYRQGPEISFILDCSDFYAGPIMDSSNYSIDMDTTWSYIWNLNRTEIEYHKLHWTDPGYVPVRDILTWPGNGDISLGQSPQLAPYFDMDKDGIYDPFKGDYPSVRGDQALYFIFNDDRGPHLESTGQKLQVEVHGMAYAFDLPGDSAFSKSIFLNYKIYNRSVNTYHNAYFGVFTDFDIGDPDDDFLISDVERGSQIGYNGIKTDGTGQSGAYGDHPPAQSMTILAGPLMAPTGSDRPRTDNGGHQLCNESINGYGFGDGISDNERLGLNTSLMFFYDTPFPDYLEDPRYDYQYYNAMKAIWMDTTHLTYGGMGHPDHGGYGPDCNFIFPGESDTLNWGSGCQVPNGLVNWTETTANFPPNDIKGVGSVGPFDFNPGEMKEIDIAYVWARDYTSQDTLDSLVKLREMIDVVRNAFFTNTLPGGGSFLGIEKPESLAGEYISVYPVPSSSVVTIDFLPGRDEKTDLQIMNSLGHVMKNYTFSRGTDIVSIDVSGYVPGIYLMTFKTGNKVITKKLPIIR